MVEIEHEYSSEELEETSEMQLDDMSGTIPRQATGLFVNAEERKALQGTTKIITILSKGSNKYKNPFLNCIMDDEERNLNVNGKNLNQLRDILSPNLSKWVNAQVKVTFKPYTQDIDGNKTNGTTLEFSSV